MVNDSQEISTDNGDRMDGYIYPYIYMAKWW